MKNQYITTLMAALLVLGASAFSACGVRGSTVSAADASPPTPVIEHDGEDGVTRVDHPEQFPLATATARESTPDLSVTGVVNPDVSRNVPVISLASGRVVEARARLGDRVAKGQLLLRIQSADVSGAFADYRKALADEVLARTQLDRANDLFGRGAIAKKDLEVAQDTEDKARVDVQNTTDHLRVLGLDPNHPPTDSGVVDVMAPVSGIITEQNVTNAAGVRTLDNSPNLFTISDLTRVWIVCDVYENDLAMIHMGDGADIHLAAYPDRVLTGHINDIGAILDPNIRTAKVRIEVENPGLMRVGMFVTATFHGQTHETRAVVPSSAILHLHDREWVYAPAGDHGFQRKEVVSGQMLPGGMQELVSGLQPGDRVVSNALVLQNTVEQ